MTLDQLKEELRKAEDLKYYGLTVAERFQGFQQAKELTKEIEKELSKYA